MTYRDFLRFFVLASGVLGLVPLGVAQNPGLQLSSSSLTFNGLANGPKLPMQAVTVTSVSSSAIDFALLVDGGAPGTPAPWLSATPLLATTPVQIRVVADPSTLAAGTYQARIQLTDRQGRSLGVIIPVTLQANTGAPQFDVTPPVVNFSGSPAAGNLQQGILVRSQGPGSLSPISASIVSGYAGLYATVDPCDTVCIVHVTSAISTLTPGAHNGIVRIMTAAGPKPMDVPVSLFAADHGPFDQLSPSAVAFEAIQVSGLSDSRTVSLINSGDSLSTWSVDVTDGAQWLSVSPASGTTAAGKSTALTVSMNLGNQSSGNYGGMVRISSPDPGALTLYLPVVLKVGVSGTSPTPLLSTGGLVFTTPTGAIESVQQQINLLAASTAPVNFQVAPQSSSWLSLVPSRGQASSTPTPLTISAAPNNQAQGFYSGLINVGFGTSVRTLHVGFSVVPTQAGICQPQTLYLTETAIPDNFAVSVGSPTPLEVVLIDECGNPIVNGVVTATFSNGDFGVDLIGVGNGHYVQTWTPLNPSDSLPGGNLSVAFQGFAPPLTPVSTEVIGSVTKAALPAIATNGVINSFIASRGLPIAPGAVVQIYGSGLATATAYGTVANGRLSSAVAGASVKIGGLDAPIAYASPTQINVQVPSELMANHQYQMIVNADGVYSKPEPINIAAVQPVIAATFPDGRIIAQDVNFNLINAQNPAHAGDVITLYLTGMGATNPPVPTGTLAFSSPLSTTVVQPQVSIATTSADILFSGLTPGGVGLYQINKEFPQVFGRATYHWLQVRAVLRVTPPSYRSVDSLGVAQLSWCAAPDLYGKEGKTVVPSSCTARRAAGSSLSSCKIVGAICVVVTGA
jgi:uncharacterized protein (TIGR03437 family)